MVLDLKSEKWGQRHFITKDPNGLLIDVIQNVPLRKSLPSSTRMRKLLTWHEK
jgi:hypothetical protein